MWLGLTESRLIVWSTTFWLSRPGAVTGVVAARRTSPRLRSARHGLVTGLAFALTNGAVVEVEAMRGRRLRRFAALAGPPRPSKPPGSSVPKP